VCPPTGTHSSELGASPHEVQRAHRRSRLLRAESGLFLPTLMRPARVSATTPAPARESREPAGAPVCGGYGGGSGASDPEGGSCVPPAAIAATAIAAPRRLLPRHQDRCEEEAPHNTLPSNATLLPMRRSGGMNEETKSSIALIFQAVEILTECPSRSSAISAYRVSDP
jgi:hypothetical protein